MCFLAAVMLSAEILKRGMEETKTETTIGRRAAIVEGDLSRCIAIGAFTFSAEEATRIRRLIASRWANPPILVQLQRGEISHIHTVLEIGQFLRWVLRLQKLAYYAC
jgi:hypothetical protein